MYCSVVYSNSHNELLAEMATTTTVGTTSSGNDGKGSSAAAATTASTATSTPSTSYFVTMDHHRVPAVSGWNLCPLLSSHDLATLHPTH
jgi:hypothetical protein